MKLRDLTLEGFFPGSSITTRFGWDGDPPGPRIHHAVDRAGPGSVYLPFAAESLQWIPEDSLGCSVLRAFADGGRLELRMLHFIWADLNPELQAAARSKSGMPAGTPIGPTGNMGLSISQHGGDGRHVHYQLMLVPGAYAEELAELAPGWDVDRRAELAEKHGPVFVRECVIRQISWINELALCRLDPWTGQRRVIINSAEILGM